MTLQERAKNWASQECRCFKCDGIDNFTKSPCKKSLMQGCQEHRWKERGYFIGATKQIELAKEWLKNNYEHFDGKVEDFVADFEKAMKL